MPAGVQHCPMTRGGLRATGVALVLHLGMMVAIVGPARPSASVCNFRCICDWYQGACIPPNLSVECRPAVAPPP